MKSKKYKAQTMLLAMLIVAATSIAIGVTVAIVASEAASSASKNKDAYLSKELAETCLEDNLVKFSRGDFNPSAFTTDAGSCTIEISGNAPYVLNVTGIVGKSVRKIRAAVSIDNEVVNIQEIKEVY